MTTTTGLQVDHLTAGQYNKYATVNAALDAMDVAIGQALTHNMTTDGNYTLLNTTASKQWRYGVIVITDTGVLLTAERQILWPVDQNRVYLVVNSTLQILRFTRSTNPGVRVPPGESRLVRMSGALITDISASRTVKTSALSGNYTMSLGDPDRFFIDPNGAARDFTLAAEESCVGREVKIWNTADAAEDITVKNDAAGTVIVISQNEMAILVCNGTTWRGAVSPTT